MSIKTLKKRIALVAVSALTVGMFSTVTMPAANAAATAVVFSDDYTVDATPATGNVGVCAVASQAATHTAGAVATTDENAANWVEMLSTGTLKIGEYGTAVGPMTGAGDETRFAISGPAIWDSFTANGDPATPSLSADGKTFTFTYGGSSSADESPESLILKATGAGTIQVTITNYDYSARADADSGLAVAKIITITSVTACKSGAPSIADSFVKLETAASASTAATTNIDATDANYAANGGSIYVRVDMYDVNDNAIATSSATGTITAEVTSGAYIGEAAVGSTTLAYSTDKSTYFRVTQAKADTAWSGTVTVKIDGTLVATKSAKILGAPATIEVSGLDIRNSNSTSGVGGDYLVKDAAGNSLEVAITGWDDLTDAQSKVITVGSSSRTPSNTAARALAGTPKGQFDFACKTPGGVAKGVRLKYTNSALASIYSATFDITCGGTAYTYAASLDKASYVPGDIATLTITAKDAYGNPVHDGDTLGVLGYAPSIAGSQMTIVTAATTGDTFLSGKKEYKFTVGSTTGSYNMVVDLPEFNSASKPQSAVTIAYKVASSTTEVSNADVLKSIVALIASINKQIQALQKLILRR